MLKTLLRSLRRIICLQEVKALSILSQRANILRHLKDTHLSILVIMDDMALDFIMAMFISTRIINKRRLMRKENCLLSEKKYTAKLDYCTMRLMDVKAT